MLKHFHMGISWSVHKWIEWASKGLSSSHRIIRGCSWGVTGINLCWTLPDPYVQGKSCGQLENRDSISLIFPRSSSSQIDVLGEVSLTWGPMLVFLTNSIMVLEDPFLSCRAPFTLSHQSRYTSCSDLLWPFQSGTGSCLFSYKTAFSCGCINLIVWSCSAPGSVTSNWLEAPRIRIIHGVFLFVS